MSQSAKKIQDNFILLVYGVAGGFEQKYRMALSKRPLWTNQTFPLCHFLWYFISHTKGIRCNSPPNTSDDK